MNSLKLSEDVFNDKLYMENFDTNPTESLKEVDRGNIQAVRGVAKEPECPKQNAWDSALSKKSLGAHSTRGWV